MQSYSDDCAGDYYSHVKCVCFYPTSDKTSVKKIVVVFIIKPRMMILSSPDSSGAVTGSTSYHQAALPHQGGYMPAYPHHHPTMDSTVSQSAAGPNNNSQRPEPELNIGKFDRLAPRVVR